MHLRRYVLALLVVLFSQSPLGAQDTDADGQFYLDLAGSAVFPYDPAGPSGPGSTILRSCVNSVGGGSPDAVPPSRFSWAWGISP